MADKPKSPPKLRSEFPEAQQEPESGGGQPISPEAQLMREAMLEKRVAAMQRQRRKARQDLKQEQMKFREEEAILEAQKQEAQNAQKATELERKTYRERGSIT